MKYISERKECIQHALFGDSKEDLDGPFEVLIGADIAGKLITENHLQQGSGLTEIETKLGWSVIGRVNDRSSGLLVASKVSTSVRIFELWELDSQDIT
ncbi:hypothetical protein TNIN_200781 [Trichonephila inaurata madagascariensis]|uniref:Peptidase aspartic putative domain-containing protein n=1 Tax=Trichonephila inaurata madagascariensis TaxID=2747483 RepID=A0A8X6IIK6_9ARAC|nr:hypothetical protein TNIN_200781 [Trichonephila inaurata madagascariensis]